MCWAVRKTALLGANEWLTVGGGVQSWGLEKELWVMGRSHGQGSRGKLVHLSGSVYIFSSRDKSTGYLLQALSSTYVSVGGQVVPDELVEYMQCCVDRVTLNSRHMILITMTLTFLT